MSATSSEPPVLLVDDDEGLRDAIKRLLDQELECSVVAFGEGPSALQFVQQTAPGLALLDVDMAPMNGLEVARQLRKVFPELPIMFITGSNHTDLAEEFAAVGAVAVLRKPVRNAELVQMVQQHRLRK